jgi:pyruvate dehydrogenase E2 component (dihydrolipoamide acetyltransferase)
MPEVATGAEEATLSEWGLQEGTEFPAATVIATVETEKAVVDVETETAGVLVRRLVEAGASVKVGVPIALLADPGEKVVDADAALAALGIGATSAGKTATANSTTDAGSKSADLAPHDADGVASTALDPARMFISPLARKLAEDAGLDPRQITGTGPNKRIRRRDVDAALIVARETAVARSVKIDATLPLPAPRSAPPPIMSTQRTGQVVSRSVEVPHSRMRRAIARRLTDSKTHVPHFYVKGTARVDRLLMMRSELNDGAAVKVSVNDLVLKAVARALMEVPEMNVTWGDDAVRRYDAADVAVAVATDAGLITPVLRGVERLSITQVAEAVRGYAARARDGALRQEELDGGSFTVSNLGMYGTEEFTGIINPPHSALLAVGAARLEPVVDDNEQLTVARVLHVTLSADHRPVDGVIGARWMQAFLTLLEQPLRIIA